MSTPSELAPPVDQSQDAVEPSPPEKSRVRRLLGRLPVVPTLGVTAALDASLLPNPLEPLLVAGMLAKRHRIWAIAVVATVGCMAGATLSYLAGVFLLDLVVQPLLERVGGLESFEQAKDQFREDGFWAIFIISMTPIPLPFAPLGAGATGMNPILAIGLVGLFRGFRYFSIAALAWFFEPALREAVSRVTTPWMTWISLAIGVGAMLLIFLR